MSRKYVGNYLEKKDGFSVTGGM